MTEPPLIVVLDPGDDAEVTRRVLAAHDPDRGAITIHPTPGARSRTGFAHDILVALGRDPREFAESLRAQDSARAAVLTLLAVWQVRQIAVLRAHLLTGRAWGLLLDARSRLGAAVVAVHHEPVFLGPGAIILERVEHHLVDSLKQADALLAPFLKTAAPRTGPVSVPSWMRHSPANPARVTSCGVVPDRGVAHFRADAARALHCEDFTHLDREYLLGLHAACGWIATQPPASSPAPAAAGWEGASAAWVFLADLVADCALRGQTLARARGAQAGLLAHGLLLRLPEPADAVGPGMTGAAFTLETAQLLRERVTHPVHAAALAAALITGADPAALRTARVPDLPAAADWLTLRRTPGWDGCYRLPAPARPLLAAARDFLLYRRPDRGQALLSMGIGSGASVLRSSAARCGLELPDPPAPGQAPWNLTAEVTRVCDPLHRTGLLHGIRAPGTCRSDSPAPNAPAAPPSPLSRPVWPDYELTPQDAAGALRLVRRGAPGHPSALSPRTTGVPSLLIERELAVAEPGTGQALRVLPHDDLLFALALPTRGPAPGRGQAGAGRAEDFIDRFDRQLRSSNHRLVFTDAAHTARYRASRARSLTVHAREPMFDTDWWRHDAASGGGR